METSDKIVEGLEIAYKKLIEYKKYKKTPMVVFRDGHIVQIPPNKLKMPRKKVYKR